MKRIFPVLTVLSVLWFSCSKTIDNTGTCSDGLKNQGEQGIDCGGPCQQVCPSCADGIRNQDETAVDCGGPCDPCYPRFSASVDGSPWSSTSRNAFISGPGTIRIYGTNQVSNITLYYSGPFAPGTVNSGTQFYGEFRDENGNLYTSTAGGTISFSTFDTMAKVVSGEFTFTAINQMSGASMTVSSGIFNVLAYQ